jgi:paraquat-inducible protein A
LRKITVEAGIPYCNTPVPHRSVAVAAQPPPGIVVYSTNFASIHGQENAQMVRSAQQYFNDDMDQGPTDTEDARQTLIACRECDLLQAEVPLEEHSDAHCIRCGATLYRGTRTSLDFMIAIALGCAALFIVSNLFPIATLEVQGIVNSTTLAGTAFALYAHGRPLVAAMVFVTVIMLPGLLIGALLYMLVPLRYGRIAQATPLAFRFLLAALPWNMIDVFLLGLVVTLVKLADLATIVPGIALWAFTGLILLFTAGTAAFSARDFWLWVETAGRAGRAAPFAGDIMHGVR